jgi:hypothetical protein
MRKWQSDLVAEGQTLKTVPNRITVVPGRSKGQQRKGLYREGFII